MIRPSSLVALLACAACSAPSAPSDTPGPGPGPSARVTSLTIAPDSFYVVQADTFPLSVAG